MSKTHWNTIDFNTDVNERLILELVDHSYNQVVAGLPKKDRERIEK